jgi:WD40 repeat protein
MNRSSERGIRRLGISQRAEREYTTTQAHVVPRRSLRSVVRFGVLVAASGLALSFWGERPELRAGKALGAHPGVITTVALSPEGHWLASAGYDSPVIIWDLSRREIDAKLGADSFFTVSMAFSADGSILATGSTDGIVRIWSVGSWILRRAFRAYLNPVRALRFLPGGDVLATADSDCTICLWPTDLWQPVTVLPGHGTTMSCVVFSPDGCTLASAGFDGTVRLRDVRTGHLQVVSVPDVRVNISRLAVSPDGRFLAISKDSSDGLGVWDLCTHCYRTLARADRGSLLALTFSGDSRSLIASSSSGLIEFWDVSTVRPGLIIRGISGAVWSLALSPDRRTLISAEFEGDLKLWDIGSPAPSG